ncbi:MAG: 3-hydroxy-5-phosphonooxypentane-2,4-dione thiolase [Christensenellales bacterium]|jgi:putative autoinducer-2 (AI-2) aldolase
MPDINGFDQPIAEQRNKSGLHGERATKVGEYYDWGMQARLSSIFCPKTGNTVMLAIDHGYIMGPTTGLENLRLAVSPLYEHYDVLMATRGALRTSIIPTTGKAIVLRCSAGSSVLSEDMSHEQIGVDIKDAIRMNAACMAIQVFIGAPGEQQSIKNLCTAVDTGMDYGIPVLGVVAVGKQMERTTRYFQLATRMLAEFGAQIVKTYYCDNFESVVRSCPAPIVVAGGKKLPENEALTMTYRAMDGGARGVDMGRNIFQAGNPAAMLRAVRGIVHDGMNDTMAFELYQELSQSN